jgi:hypothetical protein
VSGEGRWMHRSEDIRGVFQEPEVQQQVGCCRSCSKSGDTLDGGGEGPE